MFPCQRYRTRPLSRRDMLAQAAHGFGTVALTGLLAREQLRAATVDSTQSSPAGKLHFPAKAKNVIFLYMDGGPSQVDTFDPKPMLDKYDGRSPYEVIGKVE